MANEVLPLDRTAWDATTLMAAHPPSIRNTNKQAVFEIAMAGSRPTGQISWRWPPVERPDRVDLEAGLHGLDIREESFMPAPAARPPSVMPRDASRAGESSRRRRLWTT